ncbi:glutamate cyclase domain-containing protein, partial [Bordetella holmesii]|uniref:glutamate cyclase domain-containing protein n=1 Tax=Bordetella holmesii TaxID=35814 RepID=UPI000459E17C
AICDDLIAVTRPCAAIAIERPGRNAKGLYHGLGGRPLDGLVANLDYLFDKVKGARSGAARAVQAHRHGRVHDAQTRR